MPADDETGERDVGQLRVLPKIYPGCCRADIPVETADEY